MKGGCRRRRKAAADDEVHLARAVLEGIKIPKK
jgi:hypothetical protein